MHWTCTGQYLQGRYCSDLDWDNAPLSADYVTVLSMHWEIHISEYLNKKSKNVKQDFNCYLHTKVLISSYLRWNVHWVLKEGYFVAESLYCTITYPTAWFILKALYEPLHTTEHNKWTLSVSPFAHHMSLYSCKHFSNHVWPLSFKFLNPLSVFTKSGPKNETYVAEHEFHPHCPSRLWRERMNVFKDT
jgi:hypothetical protein